MTFLIPILLLVLLAAGFAAFVFWETRWVEVNQYIVPVGRGRIDKPINIVHISDIHISPWSLPSQFKPVVEFINSLKPDYVAITGDFVTHFKELIPGCAKVLSGLQPKHFTIGVLGNHDYWIDAGYLSHNLEEAGIECLINRCRPSRNGVPITFLGVDDPFTGHDDLKETARNVPDSHLRILLSHSPDIVESAAEVGIDFILAGHTHGGQVRLPFLGALYIPSRYGKRFDMGWFKVKGTSMYVNKGLGGIFPPIRFFCRREIALLKLVPEEGEPHLLKKNLVKI